MMLWAIQAQVEWESPMGVSGSRQLPTFYMPGDIPKTDVAVKARDIVGQVVEATTSAIGQGEPWKVVTHLSVELI